MILRRGGAVSVLNNKEAILPNKEAMFVPKVTIIISVGYRGMDVFCNMCQK